jgi:hypothetical protein
MKFICIKCGKEISVVKINSIWVYAAHLDKDNKDFCKNSTRECTAARGR